MKERDIQDIRYFEQSVSYSMEKTSMFYRIMGSQFFTNENFGITLEQFVVLEVLSYLKNACQRDIAKKILKDRSNVTRILNILESKGLVQREVDTKQKRLVKKVHLTEKGEELLNEIFPKVKEAYLKSLEGITKDEIDQFKITLEKIRNNLSKDAVIQI